MLRGFGRALRGISISLGGRNRALRAVPRGNERFSRGDVEGARAACEAATSADPQSASTWNNLGIAPGHLGRLFDARSSFDVALMIASRLADARGNKAVVLLRSGDPEGAIAWFEEALKTGPSSELGLMNLGIAPARRGEFDEARELFEKTLAENPRSPTSWLNPGSVFLEKGDPADALRCLGVPLAARSAFADAWYLQGRALVAAGPVDKAEGSFKEALRIQPSLAEAKKDLEVLPAVLA